MAWTESTLKKRYAYCLESNHTPTVYSPLNTAIYQNVKVAFAPLVSEVTSWFNSSWWTGAGAGAASGSGSGSGSGTQSADVSRSTSPMDADAGTGDGGSAVTEEAPPPSVR